MKLIFNRSFGGALGLGLLLFMPQIAAAQDTCQNLNTNAEWNTGIKELVQLVQNNLYDQAKVKAKQMSQQCEKSPVLNYIQGKIAEGLDDSVSARLYFQKASEYTYTYYVDKDMAQKIWYARYENEHPERTAKGIEESERQFNEKLTSQKEKLDLQQENEALRSYHSLMWVGTGIGIAGLAMLGTGIGLYVNDNDPVEWPDDNLSKYHYKNKPKYDVAWALIGAGTALTVGGVLFTGIYGYRYTRAKKGATISINVAPNFATFNMEF